MKLVRDAGAARPRHVAIRVTPCQFRILKRIARGDVMPVARFNNGTFTALKRKGLAFVSATSDQRWGLERLGIRALAEHGRHVATEN